MNILILLFYLSVKKRPYSMKTFLNTLENDHLTVNHVIQHVIPSY